MKKLISRLFRWALADMFPAKPIETLAKKMRIASAALRRARQKEVGQEYKIAKYVPPAGVIPDGKSESALAMDSTPYQFLNSTNFCNLYVDYNFPGYPIMAMWSQMPEYRKMSETLAKEMTRKWIRVTAKGDADKSARVDQMIDALERYCVQDKFRQAAELDGFFGRGQIYIDLKMPQGTEPVSKKPDELAMPLILDSKKIAKGSLIGFNVIEPVWTYPGEYNADSPLKPDFYKPQLWFVMGDIVHGSRLLPFVSRAVPDLLKASYNFGGLSISQLARPYVENWVSTRDSVKDMVKSYSLSGIKTDMGTILAGEDCEDLFARAELFNEIRTNRGLMLLNAGAEDAGGEEFFQFNTPLSGLDKLQAQSQEQMASVSSIPLVKLLGITPSGLNASSDGEIRVFYDYIASMQEAIFTDNLKIVFQVIQLSEFGEIDPDISFEFEPLHALNDLEKATVRKTDADTDAVLVGVGAIGPDEVRARVAADPDSGYNTIDTDDMPDIEEPEETEPREAGK